MKKQKNTFILYTDLLDKCSDLNNEQMGQLFRAILVHENGGELPDIDDPMVKMAYKMIVVDLDANAQKYADICKKRKQAGTRGGRSNQNNQIQANANFVNEVKQNNQMRPNAFFGFTKDQLLASEPDNDNESDSDNEINKSVNLARSRSRAYSSIDDITEAEIEQVAKQYQVRRAFVRNALDDLRNYCGSKGKRYKNYLSALRSFVKKDLNNGAKNASQLTTPGLFAKTEDNPDLARQNQIGDKKPMTEAEVAKMREAMPEFIRQKVAAREKGGNNAR